jgi:RND family efflux transporter MFP subunit
LLAGALVVGLGAGCHLPAEEHEEPVAVEVRCAPVAKVDLETTVTLRGRLAAPPGGDLPVASQVPGRVVEVHAHEGDRVVAGAVVALIDDSSSRDALRQADAVVVQSKAALANADATLDRTRQLVGRGIAAKQELDDAVARDDQAKASLNASIAASDLARRTLGRVVVRSTFDGVVTRVWRGAGALVDGTAATPIVQLAATSAAELDADATERQLATVAAGQGATIRLDEGKAALGGTVRARSTALDPATGLGLVRIALAESPDAGTLTLGAFGAATVRTGTRQSVLVVPAAAIRGATADGAEVAICAEGKAEVRTVKVGWRDDQQAEVIEGLHEGDRVAVDHVLGLETGTPLVEGKPDAP